MILSYGYPLCIKEASQFTRQGFVTMHNALLLFISPDGNSCFFMLNINKRRCPTTQHRLQHRLCRDTAILYENSLFHMEMFDVFHKKLVGIFLSLINL